MKQSRRLCGHRARRTPRAPEPRSGGDIKAFEIAGLFLAGRGVYQPL